MISMLYYLGYLTIAGEEFGYPHLVIPNRVMEVLLIPRDRTKGYHSIMMEFKYLKKGEKKLLKEKQEEARKQIEKYSKYDEMQDIENLHKYTVIAVVDEIYIEEL